MTTDDRTVRSEAAKSQGRRTVERAARGRGGAARGAERESRFELRSVLLLSGMLTGLAFVLGDAAPASGQATPTATPKPPIASIDDELLRDLPLDPPRPPSTEPPAPDKDRPEGGPAGKPSEVPGGRPAAKPQEKPQEKPGEKPPEKPDGGEGRPAASSDDEGEDVTLVGPDEFLRDIRRRMAAVAQRIRQQDVSRSTQAEQRRIADELDSFVQQLEQRSGGRPDSKRGGGGVESDQSGGGDQRPTQGAAVESAERNTESARTGEDAATSEAATDDVWARLPPQLRQQLRSLTSDKFLPQYERLIQQYYRRLAESPRS